VLGRRGWNSIQSLRTDAAGGLQTKVRLAYNHAVRAAYAGEPTLGGAFSNQVLVGVHPLVRAQLGPSTSTSLARGDRLTIEGSVRPHKSSALLLVDRITRTGRAVRVGRRLLRVRAGAVRARFRFERAGSYKLRLAVRPDARNLAARSTPLAVKVR
jgi:hypothetical protein